MKDEIGKRIKQLREEAGKTQKQVGQAMGLTEILIRKIENGERNLTLDNAKIIKHYFHTTYDYLIEGKKFPDDTSSKIFDLADSLTKQAKKELIKQIIDTL